MAAKKKSSKKITSKKRPPPKRKTAARKAKSKPKNASAAPESTNTVSPMLTFKDAGAAVVLEQTQAALAEVRRVRSLQKRGAKILITTAVLPSAYAGLARQDFVAALHIQALSFADVAEPVLTFAEEPTA